jgi:hypothetical protein
VTRILRTGAAGVRRPESTGGLDSVTAAASLCRN